jgi:CheY-like chemotaxis protein
MIETLNLNIVLVEDDDVAAESVMRGLTRNGVGAPVMWAQDGEMALRVLRGSDPEPLAPRLRVALLDLNMPRMNGFEFLQHVRGDPALHDEVVFVLTASDTDADRVRLTRECRRLYGQGLGRPAVRQTGATGGILSARGEIAMNDAITMGDRARGPTSVDLPADRRRR